MPWPFSELPGVVSVVLAAVSGGLATEFVRAIRARGQAFSTERLSLQAHERDFRKDMLRENRLLRARLQSLEQRVQDLQAGEDDCKAKNDSLEEEIQVLRERNEKLQTDLDALSARISERAKGLIQESMRLPARAR